MKRSKKSRKVSWPPDDVLCQVRMFVSDDCPLLVGVEAQDQLQEKASWILHSNIFDSYELPPGFDALKHVNQLEGKVSCIPKIDWKTPPRVGLSHNWQVAAGEESEEALAEEQRQLKVLEALYPQHSAIPSSPSVASSAAESCQNDDNTPIVPIIPIEEDEAANFPSILEEPALTEGLMISATPDLRSYQYSSPQIFPTNKKNMFGKALLETDVIAAASVAHTVLMKSKEDGSMIDTNLLIKILTDPKMVEMLVESQGCPAIPEKSHIPSSRLENPKSSLSFTKADIRTSPMLGSGKLYSAQPTSIVMPLQGETTAYKEATPVPLAKPVKPLTTQSNLVSSPSYREATPVPLAKPMPVMVPPVSSQPSLVSSLPLQSLANPSAAAAQPAPTSRIKPAPTRLKQVSSLDPLPTSITDRASLTRQSTGNMPPVPKALLPVKSTMVSRPHTAPVCSPVVRTPIPKDANYFKNLVKQHGGERQEPQDQNHLSQRNGRSCDHFESPELHLKPIQTKKPVKIEKPCIYYNSSIGCRNGSSCPYQHGLPFQCYSDDGMWEAQTPKRMRLG